MNAQDLTKALGGRWHGADGVARCPAHDDHEPSLSLRDGDDGRLLTHCFAGCSAEAVWAALVNRGLVGIESDGRGARPTAKLHPMGSTSATSAASDTEISASVISRGPTAPRPSSEGPPDHVNHQRSALEIWCATRPAEGSPVETYLRSRGITIATPPTIRYHPAIKHPDIGQHLPAMVAAVCNVERNITGIQRTYLTMDGRKAPLNRPRMALGALRGHAVRLAPVYYSGSESHSA